MVQINLLPWREEAKQLNKISFMIAALIFVGCSIFMLLLLHVHFSRQLTAQRRINNYIQTELDAQNQKIANTEVSQKALQQLNNDLNFISNLYKGSFDTITLLNELTKLGVDSIIFNKIEKYNQTITFSGMAGSNSNLAALMQEMGNIAILDKPVLSKVSTDVKTNKRIFEITVKETKE